MDHESQSQAVPPVRSGGAIEFGTEEIMQFGVKRTRITHPNGAPFDGKPVLIKLASGWVEAWWEEGYSHHGELGGEGGGFQWICLDDQFQADFDEPSHWSPIPEITFERVERLRAALTEICRIHDQNAPQGALRADFQHIARRALEMDSQATMTAPTDERTPTSRETTK